MLEALWLDIRTPVIAHLIVVVEYIRMLHDLIDDSFFKQVYAQNLIAILMVREKFKTLIAEHGSGR